MSYYKFILAAEDLNSGRFSVVVVHYCTFVRNDIDEYYYDTIKRTCGRSGRYFYVDILFIS